uniref:Glycosylated lysosomal membrane protein n=1 Tax=Strigops habroptila TaxID=2489341 RepID=A0A672UY82_STRHB
MAAAVVVLLLLVPVVAAAVAGAGGGRRVSGAGEPGWGPHSPRGGAGAAVAEGASGRTAVCVGTTPAGNNSSVNLLHVRAVGPADTLHYVWQQHRAPAVLLVATQSSTSTLGINWTGCSHPPPARGGPPSGSTLPAASPTRLPLSSPNGRVAATSPCHLLQHSETAPRWEFVLAGVAPRSNSSRFVLEVAAVEEPGVAPELRAARSIDDEYTPTIFEAQNDSSPRSFLQWKATAYGSRSPRREDGIRCRSHGLRAANWSLPMSAFVSAVNISFGERRGRFTQEKRYLRSALLGFGQPPQDTFSPLVISIMAVALGTPVLLLLLGSCLLLCAQRKRYSEYEPIN